MNMYTKVSDKGQVVVPKALRDLKGWPAGTDLEAVDLGEGVFLRRRDGAPNRKKLTVEEAVARLRKVVHYDGPVVPIEKLSWSADVDD